MARAPVIKTGRRFYGPPGLPAFIIFAIVLAAILVIGALAAEPGRRTITGTITDSMCATADHSQMKMGPTDAECTIACNDVHGAQYVLYDGRETWTLSDQKTPERFAGQKVTVTGALDAKTKTIRTESITAAR